MSIHCPFCQRSNPDTARFCQGCGNPMDATSTNGKTRVYSPSGATGVAATAVNMQQVMNRVTNAFGSSPIPQATLTPHAGGKQQHEATALVIDTSGSMGGNFDNGVTKLDAAIRAACNLINNKANIDLRDEVAVISFNDSATLWAPHTSLQHGKPVLLSAVQSLMVSGGTDLNAGLIEAERSFDWRAQATVRRIVMLTDGEGGEPVTTAKRLRDAGVVIDIVGVGPTASDVNEKLLRQLASSIAGELHYRFIRDHESLIAHYTQLANKTRVA